MLIYFCPDCRQVVRGQYKKCPTCRRELTIHPQAAHEQKLISDLDHPVKGSRLLAIEMLGKLKSRNAVPRLKAIIDAETDPHILQECVKALSLIGAAGYRVALLKASRRPSTPASKPARQYIGRR